MKKLICEMCGSNDLVKQEGLFVCQACGSKYSVEDAKKMMVEVSGQVSIDDSGKLATYIQMADSAYSAGNWQEAYNYYGKAQEIDVNNYHSIYRRGLSYGWQGNLMDFREQEVAGAIVNAKKAMAKSNDDPHTKALETANMMSNMANWVGSLAGASIRGGYQSITSSPTAAKNFFERMCIISELFIFAFEILDEQSYANLTIDERKVLKNNAQEIASLTNNIASTMRDAGSLRVNDGIKFNPFWLMYEDSYKQVKAPSSVPEEAERLASASNKFKNQFSTWDKNIVEQEEREIKEKRENFLKENPDIHKEYDDKIKSQKKLEELKKEAERQLSSAENNLNLINSKISELQNSIDSNNTDIKKLQKRLFGKKKAEEEILKKQAEIKSFKVKLSKLENPKKEAEAKVDSVKNILDQIYNKLNTIDSAIKEIFKMNGLE